MIDFAEYWLNKKANREELPLISIEQLAQQLQIPEAVIYGHAEALSAKGANDPRQKAPVSPGLLIQTALDHIQLTQAELANMLGMSRQNMHRIIHGDRGITAENAIVLEAILRIPAHVFLRLQADYDLYRALRHSPVDDPITPHSTI